MPVTIGLLLSASCVAADEPSRYKLDLGADLSFVDASGYPSWAEGSAGKLRYDPDSDGLMLSQAYADYSLRLADTLDMHTVALLYSDDIGSTIDFSEAYLQWRPMTLTENRYRLKLGAFYPRVSLENSGPGWSTPYTISSSAINTWIAEEFRTFGAELSLSRKPQFLGGLHTLSLQAAAFYLNDPAGTLLSWKGWSVHDRQTRFGDELPLPPVPQIQPGMAFDLQDPFLAPFREIDDRIGYYINAEWSADTRFLVRIMHYDNRADPESYEDGQFGWRTKFDHVGLQATLPGDFGLIAQWMEGSTVWGWYFNGVRAVDADFYSGFLLLTKSLDRHRLSLRYDLFDVSENDDFPLDENSEYGHAWTLAYQYRATDFATLAIEWLEIETYRDAWEYFGLEDEMTESQLQISLRLRFSGGS
ncbi:MAG TPA: hypothetical protein VLB07_11040 [Woeseiaceae bacterium]|nr:hypothetical protein [Woeseiaceae bacterium]